MKNLTLLGKVNVGLGIIFFIIGISLFIQKFNGAFIYKEQHLSLSFIFLALTLFCASFFTTKDKE
ncbi:hypothetical protein WAK64_05925 [Bacillus spongiae]|uniref:Uncharacterized protein n=1 Tax=Bacillus spongiae TaxID=2683610 RepID=A0ABU8HB99_9BACI